jgi:hypothetical protein
MAERKYQLKKEPAAVTVTLKDQFFTAEDG